MTGSELIQVRRGRKAGGSLCYGPATVSVISPCSGCTCEQVRAKRAAKELLRRGRSEASLPRETCDLVGRTA